MTTTSNRLTVLAADIRAAHSDIQRSALGMAERAIAAGHMLIEAKATVLHGEYPGYFHVLVLGRIDGQDHSACTTVKPCSSEALPRVIAECGFPIGTARFEVKENTNPRSLEVLRLIAVGSGEVPEIIEKTVREMTPLFDVEAAP
jgi:hypothetical protein